MVIVIFWLFVRVFYCLSENHRFRILWLGSAGVSPKSWSLFFWRGFWVICAPALNHKLKKFCTFRDFLNFVLHKIAHVEETKTDEIDYWKATPWDNVFLKIFNGASIQDGWPKDPITTEMITPRCGLTLIWLFTVISLQQFLWCKFRNMFTE